MYPFKVEGMGCEACARKITQAIEARDPDARVRVDRGAQRVDVASTVAERALADLIGALGSRCTP